MKVGFAGYSWPGLFGQPGELTLEQAAAAGLEVMQFLEPTGLSRDLDPQRLRAIRAAGDSLGVTVEMGVNHLELVGDRVSDTALAKFSACLAAGYREITTLTNLNRGDPAEPMASQLERLTRALEALEPLFRAHGARLNLETHEDLTSDEVVRVIDRLDPAVLGVTLDVANFVVNAEDPVAATRRVAARVRQTHLEDVRLHLVPHGIRRITCPVGEGIIDWAEIVGTLAALEDSPHLCVELHRGQFDAEVFDPNWLTARPDLRAAELAGQMAHAVAGTEARGNGVVDRGEWPTPVGSAPHPERIAAITTGVGRLRAECRSLTPSAASPRL